MDMSKHNPFGEDGLRNIRERIAKLEKDGPNMSKDTARLIKLLKAQEAIMVNGGRWQFPELYDLKGKRIPAEIVTLRFGPVFKLEDGTYVNFKRKPATLAAKGYAVKFVDRVAWAKLKFGRVEIYPSDINYWDITDEDD